LNELEEEAWEEDVEVGMW